MISNLRKLIVVGLNLSIFYVLLVYYSEIQMTRADIFDKNIVETPEASSNNLLKNDTVQYFTEMDESAIWRIEESDIKGRKINAEETTDAEMLIEMSSQQLKHEMVTDTEAELSPEERAKIVQKRCERFLRENETEGDHSVKYKNSNRTYLTSRHYNISLCINPKVASTNIRRILYALDHNLTGDVNRISIGKARSYGMTRSNPYQRILAKKDHVSIMFIREPMERLLSAYRQTNMSITFKEFLQQILDKNTEKLNRHMYPYYENCHPCEKKYDFIVSQKTFQEDIKVVLRRSNLLAKVGIPDRAKTGYSEKSEEVLQSYYKNVPNDMIHKLWEKYKKDYYIFGFPYPSHLMNKTS